MKVTPLELRKADFKRSVRGYNPEEVQHLLASASETLEEVVRDNLELKQQLAGQKERLKSYESLEKTLNDTLLMAQKASDSTRQAADREAELVIARAEVQAEKLLEEARGQLHLLKNEIEMLGYEKTAFLVKMRSLVASQWKLLQEESVAGRKLSEAREADEEQSGPVFFKSPSGEKPLPEETNSEDGAVEEQVEDELPVVGNLSRELGKILRADAAPAAEKSTTEAEEPAREMMEEQSAAVEDKDSLFWSEEPAEETTEENKSGSEKPEVFWGDEASEETKKEKKKSR